ncbi:glycosyltransferase family 2 protein [Cohnella terricola]|uniref:Glycosyltransferase family 2 protein n=1 Tax=Cohnella terricola TaxID=1289167 RepID=A0A559JFJ4_9BACL|nr:glycosyltransferase family 2 protein [Cohnella terricola]TVX98651.1 glycosyltransferase family 2 protein [Cohnella terricola]
MTYGKENKEAKPAELSIVIPVYNSQISIEIVVTSLLRLYNHLFSLEIILVNDGSKDDSRRVCENLGDQYTNVIVLHHETNRGQQLALMTGLKHCRGDLVVLMDDDMQNPPSEVIKLINKINEGYDVVMGQRMINNQSWIRQLASRLNHFIVFMSTNRRISFSNFVIMRRAIVTMIIQNQSPKPVILGPLLKSKASMANTLTEHHQRKHGKSNYNLMKLLNYWIKAVPYYMSPRVKYSILLMSIILVVGLTAGVYFIMVPGHIRP